MAQFGQCAFGEQVTQQVRNAERGRKGVHGPAAAEQGGKDLLARNRIVENIEAAEFVVQRESGAINADPSANPAETSATARLRCRVNQRVVSAVNGT